MTIVHSDGRSADVKIFLQIGGERLRVAQVGPNSMILRDLRKCPPGTSARVIISVDGHEDLHDIVLQRGIGDEAEVHFV